MGACYLFDLDGTLADISHRLHYIHRPARAMFEEAPGEWKPDWDAFFDACADDKPIPHMIALCRTLAHAVPLLFVSGRGERCRYATQQWLASNALFGDLYMRADGDHRADNIVKGELLDRILAGGWQPIMAFEDRDQVVKMWRARGIPCAQVAEGNF